MLLRFSTKNYKTFREKAVLSLIASNYDKDTREADNVYDDSDFGLRILKSAVVYGANASGKSNLLEAFAFMRRFVINSSKESLQGDPIEVDPFRLSTETENEPSEFEIIFIQDKVLYRYGFEATKEKVNAEWLYAKPKTKEVEIFYRDANGIETHDKKFQKGRTVVKEGLIRDNALLVSVAAQFNDPVANSIIDWFKRLKTLSGIHESGYKGFSMAKTKNLSYKSDILEFLKAADLGIRDIQLQKLDKDNLPSDMPNELRDRILRELSDEKAEIISDVLTFHKRYDGNKRNIGNAAFSLDDDESSGTKKFFALSGPIIDVLENGHILVIDELDSKLHPNLVCKIVSLFNSEDFNKKNAQLIFNTHDTNLLSSGLFRRDQIWFTDKNKYGEARLYSLADFKTDEVRKTEPFEENYIKGKYGAVPYLGFFDNFDRILSQYENER